MRITICLLFLAVSACATKPSGGSFCDIARPLRFTERTISAMTDEEVRDVLKFNSSGQALCHWQSS